jgi:CubicO group peptidase (beta-lactamase class C family)
LSIAEILAAHRIPGAQVVHRRGGSMLLDVGCGVLEAMPDAVVSGRGAAVTSSSVFQAASLSKVVFSYLVLRRVQQGLLDLDRPLWEYVQLSRLRDSEPARAITARMVLSHTTGLPNWHDGAGNEEAALIPEFTPGTRFTYSGDAFTVLQQVVEHLDGVPLEVSAAREIFEPWGMSDSSFVGRDADLTRTASGHGADGASSGPSHFRRANAAFTLTTSASDYSRFLQRAVILGEGLSPVLHAAWLSPASDAALLRSGPSLPPTSCVRWGLGLGLELSELGPVAWHWGDNGNHRAFFVALPESAESLVMMFNAEQGQECVEEILGEVFPGTRFACVDWVQEYYRGGGD